MLNKIGRKKFEHNTFQQDGVISRYFKSTSKYLKILEGTFQQDGVISNPPFSHKNTSKVFQSTSKVFQILFNKMV